MDAPDGDEKAHGASGGRQQGRFGEHLPQKNRAARAQSRADRKLPLARTGSGQEKLRDVGAADREQQGDGAEQGQEAQAELASEEIIFQPEHVDLEAGVALGVRRGEIKRDRVELRAGGNDGDSAPETADDEELAIAALGRAEIGRQGCPKLHAFVARQREVRWHDAHDGIELTSAREQQGDGAEQGQESQAKLASEEIIFQPEHVDLEAGVALGVRRGEIKRDRVELRAGGNDGDSAPETADDEELAIAALGRTEIGRKGCPDLHAFVARKREVRWHDAYDGIELTVELQGGAEDSGVGAVSAAPGAVREDGDATRFRAIVGARHRAPQDRMPSQDREEIAADAGDRKRFGFSAARERGSDVDESRQALEALGLPAPVFVVAIRRVGMVEPGRSIRCPQRHDSIGIRKPKGAQEERVDAREHRAGGPHADGERQDRRGGEPGAFREKAEGVLEVADHAAT